MPFQVIKFLDKFSNFDSPNKLANYGGLGEIGRVEAELL